MVVRSSWMEYAPKPSPAQLAALGAEMHVDLHYARRIRGGLGCTMDVLRSASADRRWVVLRRHGPWWVERGVDVATREFVALDRLAAAGVPAPEPLWLGRGDIFEEPTIVISYIEGRSGVVVPDDHVAWAEHLAAVIAQIHALPVDEVLRNHLADGPPESLGSQPPPGFFDHPLAGDLLAKVRKLRASAAEHERTLIHADLWPGNTMWRGSKLVAVVDWEDAAFGDPMTDVAYCALDMRYIGLDGVSDHFVEHYRSLTGRSLDTFEYWTASALLRPMPDIAQWIPAWEQLGHPGVDADRLRARHSQLVHEVLNDSA